MGIEIVKSHGQVIDPAFFIPCFEPPCVVRCLSKISHVNLVKIYNFTASIRRVWPLS